MYSLLHIIKLGVANSGLSLRANLYDTVDSPNGGNISTNFSEVNQGDYKWYYTSFPDDFRGYAKITDASGNYMTVVSINPEEAEYSNTKVSTRATQTSVDTIDDFVDTEVLAIKAKTDNLPSDPADASDIASSFSNISSNIGLLLSGVTVSGYQSAFAPLTSGQITNAVWDTSRSAHTTNGSFGQGVLVAISGIVSSSFGISAIDANAIAPDAITSSELATTAANEIRDAVTAMFPSGFSNMTIYSDGSVNASGISGQGVGSNILSIYLYNSNGDIIGGGRVDIRASGTNTFLDTGVSNSSTGRVDFNLDDGQYSIYAYKNSMTHWTNPLYINLTTDTSINYSGVALTVNPPASNNLVRVYSYIEDLGLDPVAGVEMTFKPSGVQFFDNTLVTGDSLIATTDGDGFVYGDIAGGIGYRVQIPAANYSTWVVTPSSGIVNILDL